MPRLPLSSTDAFTPGKVLTQAQVVLLFQGGGAWFAEVLRECAAEDFAQSTPPTREVTVLHDAYNNTGT